MNTSPPPSPAPPEPGSAGAPDAGITLELRPRCALTPAGARWVVVSAAIPTFALALLFTAMGFWPVLVMAVLEIAALGWALHRNLRAGARRERVHISANSVAIQYHGPGRSRSVVFPRHWARVTLHAPLRRLHPSRLVIESQGRACELGGFLTEDERSHLARRLKLLVGNMNHTPALQEGVRDDEPRAGDGPATHDSPARPAARAAGGPERSTWEHLGQ